MIFDIINITEEEANALDIIQLKLLRTAQQKKNELTRKLEQELAEVKRLTYSNRMNESSVYVATEDGLMADYNNQVEILREQLVFNMSARDPTVDGDTGGSGSDATGYIVDYELSYVERYISVRDYYFTIEDPNERLALYRQDMVAYEYLGSYYGTLFNYLVQFTQT